MGQDVSQEKVLAMVIWGQHHRLGQEQGRLLHLPGRKGLLSAGADQVCISTFYRMPWPAGGFPAVKRFIESLLKFGIVTMFGWI